MSRLLSAASLVSSRHFARPGVNSQVETRLIKTQALLVLLLLADAADWLRKTSRDGWRLSDHVTRGASLVAFLSHFRLVYIG
jgi:hypothetical protein